MTLAERQHKFIAQAMKAGRIVLVYNGVTDPKPMIARTVAVVNSVLTVNGVSCNGMTVALKP